MNPGSVFQAIDGNEFERLVLETGCFKDSEAYYDHLSVRSWIFAKDTDRGAAGLLRKHYPDKSREIIGRAEQVYENCFDIHGSGPTYLGAKIDWHLDFKSGRIWKKDFYQSVPMMFWGDHSDAKVPWELSRFHYLVDIALAFNLTGLNKYRQKFIQISEDWIYENPCPYGINWTSPMEASIRAVNWLAAYSLFDPSSFDVNFKSKFFRLLYQHGQFIWENLAQFGPGLNNNHYLFDITGLLVLGRLFYDLHDGQAWHEFARGEFENEVFNQISPDGTCYESSLNYQMVIMELYLFAYNFENGFNEPFDDGLKARLMQSCAALYAMAKPDCTVPNFGDCGSDRLLLLDNRDERDIRYLMDLAAVTIGLAGYIESRIRPEIEVLLLTGERGLDRYFEKLVSPVRRKNSVFFNDSGLAVMRDNKNYLGFFANSVNNIGLRGYKHNDLLSLEYSWGNDNFIVDSGTYVYTGDPSGRNYFRKTSSHSTLEVDGQEINRFLPKILFSIRKDADIREIQWDSNAQRDFISAEHSGYSRLEHPVIVRRSIYFDRENAIYLFKDEFLGSGKHLFSGNLILDSKINAGIFGNNVLLMAPSGNISMVVIVNDDWYVEKIPHYISKSYGSKQESWKIRYSQLSKAPRTCIWGLFSSSSYDGIHKKTEMFYESLNKTGWKTGEIRKLELKKSGEIAVTEEEIELVQNPGLGELEHETNRLRVVEKTLKE